MDGPSDDVILAAAFPGELQAILERRRRDSEFDEVCSDFVLLARLAGADRGDASDSAVQESLAGLRQEIEAALQRASPISKD